MHAAADLEAWWIWKDSFVTPAGTAFRGYRWPRDADEPCVFLAVSTADVETAREPISEERC